jgi:hypothetical protein
MNLIGAGVSSLRLSISIVAFVENVTRERSPDFVSPGERIAAGSEAKKKNLMLIAWKDDVPANQAEARCTVAKSVFDARTVRRWRPSGKISSSEPPERQSVS